jgi:hypothetical protein
MITPMAQLAAQQQLALRVISLDPALTARVCLASITLPDAGQPQTVDFIFHS